MATIATNFQLDMESSSSGVDFGEVSIFSVTDTELVFTTQSELIMVWSGSGFVNNPFGYTLSSVLFESQFSDDSLFIGDLNLLITESNADFVVETAFEFNGADVIVGSDFNDILLGHGGDDTIVGGAGNDTINGGDGTDLAVNLVSRNELFISEFEGNTVIAGKTTGTDTLKNIESIGIGLLDGGGVRYTLDQATSTNSAVFYEESYLAANPDISQAVLLGNTSSGLEHYLFFGFKEGRSLGVVPPSPTPTEGSDSVMGTDDVNIVQGLGGNDTLKGFGGDDVIDAGSGEDFVNGNQGNDSVSGDAGNDHILGGKNNDTVSGGIGDDLVNGNNDNDTVNGNDGNDTVHGGKNDDVISGDEGNDQMYGDLGNDSITGGTGADIFVFSADSGIDVITDFTTGTDKIHIASDIMATTALAVAAFSGGVIDLGDGNTVTLTGITSVAESDFIIF